MFLALLTSLQTRTFLSQICDEEAKRLIDFVTFIVRFSVPKSRPDLKEKYEAQISELLDLMYEESDDQEGYELLSNYCPLNYTIIPAVCHEKPEFFLCKKKKKKKGWFKKKWHHFTHWVDKYKEPIIAVGVVAGVATIAACTLGMGASSAAAVGGAVIGAAANDDDDMPRPINKPGNVYVDNWDIEPCPPPSPHSSANPIPTPSNNPTPLELSHDLSFEKIEDAKLEIANQTQSIPETTEETYLEKAKNVTKTVVSNMVHDVFESVSKIGTTWHELHPNSTPEDAQAYKAFVAAQHQKIDEIFGTYCPDYSLESQEYAAAYKAAIIEELGHFPEMQMGELPPPGALINAVSRAVTVASRALGTIARSGSAIGTAVTVGSMIDRQIPTLRNLTSTFPQLQLESQIRNDLLVSGYHVPPRPVGVPENWNVEPSEKGGGIKYTLEITKKKGDLYNIEEVRVMPANPNSPNEGQRRPYVTHRIENNFYDKDGNVVPKNSLEAHIEYDEYDFGKISDNAPKG